MLKDSKLIIILKRYSFVIILSLIIYYFLYDMHNLKEQNMNLHSSISALKDSKNELEEKIDDLESEVDELKRQIEEVENRSRFNNYLNY